MAERGAYELAGHGTDEDDYRRIVCRGTFSRVRRSQPGRSLHRLPTERAGTTAQARSVTFLDPPGILGPKEPTADLFVFIGHTGIAGKNSPTRIVAVIEQRMAALAG
jgi:hypothetical protein